MNRQKETLPTIVSQQLQEQAVQNGDTICCALSGGADSVCLLRCLQEMRDNLSIHVTAVHVNHQLRGEESERDQKFCETLCHQLRVPLTIHRVNVTAYAKKSHCSIELAARECRYKAFADTQADWIVTAHTASDNLETLLHRLIRGAGLHGMTAIPPKNGRFLRPLLTVTREEILAYLHTHAQAYVTDSSNHTDTYTRNRIRHKIVPELTQLNPNIAHTVTHTLRGLRLEDAYMSQQTEIAYQACQEDVHTLTNLNALHPALQMRCLAKLLDDHKISYDASCLERLQQLVQQGGKWNLTKNVYAIAKQGTLTIETIPKKASPPEKRSLQWGENRLYSGYVLCAKLIEDENLIKISLVHKKYTNRCFDYDKIKGTLTLCPRIYGARMQLCGRDFTSSLKKCIQTTVPPMRRETLHFLTDDVGVVFAEYIGIADRVRPDKNTRHLLVLKISEEPSK